jgi:hypothetical protein
VLDARLQTPAAVSSLGLWRRAQQATPAPPTKLVQT